MRIERTKNAKRNMFWGLLNKITTLVIPFFCRTAIIQVFGINYVGLNSLFTSILSTLNLAELGFGSAVVFFMYQAIATDNSEQICSLMNYFKNVYRIIGTVVLIMGLTLIPFLKFFVNIDVPTDINIYLIYLFTLASTVLSYFLFAYKSCIFNAFQRNDVLLNISTIISIVERILQLFFIFVLKNYYMYIAASIISVVINNILVAISSKKYYPEYNPRGKLDKDTKKEIASKIKGLIFYKIGNVVSGSADTIVISSFLGLSIMGKYGNYYYVISTLFAFISIYYSAIRSGIGNSIALESKEKNFNDFKLLQFMQKWITLWCTVCLLCLFQDFITIYVGASNRLPFGIVICFCLYFWIWKMQDIVNVFKEASGLWNQDKYRPLIGSIVNLVLNLITVNFFGLYGVILSTVFQLLVIDMPWASKVLFKNYFLSTRKYYFLSVLKGLIETVIICTITYFVCNFVKVDNEFLALFIKGFICIIIPNCLFVLFNLKDDQLKLSINRLKYSIVKR